MNAAVEQGLVTVPSSDTAMAMFTALDAAGIEPLLEMIRERIDEFVTPDVETVKGRKEIASFAHKIVQSKTALEEVGKALADEAKAIPKKIDASRKRIKDTLDEWRSEVRKPLDDWESAEERRVKRHVDQIAAIAALGTHDATLESAVLRKSLIVVEAIELGPRLEEFEAEYARAKDAAIRSLKAALATREKYDADQSELAALRREAEERKAKDHEESIRRAATEKAERDAAVRAQSEREAIEAAAKAERVAAEWRELELQRQVEESKRIAVETEARVKREAEEAAARVAAETKAREADKAHKAKINSAAMAAFVAGGLSHAEAIKAVVMIAKKQVPQVFISY
jgi:hypothetical protein